MSQIIITEYKNVGSLGGGSFSQSKPSPVPGKILSRKELDGSGAGEASADFHPDTRIVKIHAIDEQCYFDFVDDPALVTTDARDYLNEKESVYHGIFNEGVQIYHNVSVVDATDVT